MQVNGTTYYYVTNLQGDVMGLVDTSGNSVASYTYDPYGKLLTATGELAEKNPLRYRGYYYDSESGLYYLQSRYYDPAVRRFINADSYASTGQGIVGYNMFSYCNNNPVTFSDPSGHVGYRNGFTYDLLFDGCSTAGDGVGGGGLILGIIGVIGGLGQISESLQNELKEIEDRVARTLAESRATSSYGDKQELHHIVAKNDSRAALAAMILNEVLQDGVNGAENLVYLKKSLHRTLHTDVYHRAVSAMIIWAYESAGQDQDLQKKYVIETLGKIRLFLKSLEPLLS